MCTDTGGRWDVAVAAYLEHAAAGGAPATTRTTRRQQLERVGRALGGDPWLVSGEQLVAWMGAHERWSAETRRSVRTTLRSFYAWALEAGHVVVSPALALPVVKASAPNPRPTPTRVLEVALAEAEPRTRLMVRLGVQMGLRRSEVARIHPGRDLIEDLEGWSLTVHGKGGKIRVVPVPADLERDLVDVAGFLFPGADAGHLSPRWVGRLVADALPDAWTMHSLRHRFATRFHLRHGDVFALQELLGHASPATTVRYVKLDQRRLRQQMADAA